MKNIVSYGGGTQSTAMILMALNGEYGLERPDFGVYADTGGEPKFINEYVTYFIDLVKREYDFDIYRCQYKMGLLHEIVNNQGISKSGKIYISSNPPFHTVDEKGQRGMMMRQCTTDYKINPIKRFIKYKIGKEEYRMWMGISFDERSRMKISIDKQRQNYYPLVENFVRRIDSINYVESLGLKKPQRSSCYFCPFHSDNYWQWIKDNHHETFQDAVHFENIMRSKKTGYRYADIFLHRSCKPLDQVQFTDKNQLNMFPELIDECDGECGI